MKRKALLLLFFIGYTLISNAQLYNIKQYTTKNGLAQSYVNHILRDSKGYLWMATQAGISRFDGKKFKTFTSKEGLPGSDITYSCEDAEGNIWIATNGFGVAKYNGTSFEIFDDKNGLKHNIVYCIFKDSKNNLWFATYGGITKYDGNKFKTFTKKDGLPTNEFFSVCEDNFGNIWMGSRGFGLVKYDGKKFKTFTMKDGLSDETIFSLYKDHNSQIWIGTASGGACVWDGEKIYKAKIPLTETEFISSIREDKYGNIWLATDHQLIKYSKNGTSFFRENNGLSSNQIYSLCIDMEGNLWVGTDNGANLFKNEAFVTYTVNEGLTNDKVTAVFKDSKGNLLIGTSGGGVNVLKDDQITSLNHIPQIKNCKVFCFYEDHKGNLWIGADSWDYGAVMLKYENGEYVFGKNYNSVNDKKFSSVTSILEDKEGNIWLGIYGSGIVIIKENSIEHYTDENGLPNNNIFTMLKDSRNNIWISAYQGGILKYDGVGFSTFNESDGLGDNSIYSIAETKNGDLIFGNYENGITLFKNNQFKTFNIEDGLCSNIAQALVCDSRDYVWMGTDKGINKIKFNKQGEIESIKFYNETYGLKGSEINQNGFFVDDLGNLWIGTNHGLTKYDYHYDYINDTPPFLVLNDVKLNFETPDWAKMGIEINRKNNLPKNLVLKHTDNHLTFNFQAITTDNVSYQYMLVGLENDWTPLSEKTEVVYPTIPPGEYIFKVKAINSDGTWSKEELSFPFTISPPFWQTWWFRILVLVIIFLIVLSIFRWRTAQLAKEKKILEEKVTERTLELQFANGQLSVALDDIKDSIHYAQRIQNSILPDEILFNKVMKNSFVLFKPKDIVSGDFYWISNKNGLVIFATCDCTGHGVPGGFMTMLGSSYLNEIVNENGITEPGEVLDQLREKIILSLKQTGAEGENKDGMDMVLCVIDQKKNTLTYSAANNGFYIMRNNELLEFTPDKQPIGFYSHNKPFSTHTIQLEKEDIIYTFTDGYADQFGGPKGKKFKYKQLEEMLRSIHEKPMDEQKEILDTTIKNWMSDYEQVDDICLMGVKI